MRSISRLLSLALPQDDPRSLWRYTLLLTLVNSLAWLVVYSYARHYLDDSDMVENYAWGMAWTLGNNKHPPLFGWITAAWFQLFPTDDDAYYLLNELNLAIALGLLALAMRRLLNPAQVLVAIVLTILFSRYGIDSGYKYNANTAQLPFIAGFVWAALTATLDRKRSWWVYAGLFAAAAALCKYSALVLLLASVVGIWLTIRPDWRQVRDGALIATPVFLLAVAPHVWWETVHHWPSLHYMHSAHPFDGDDSELHASWHSMVGLLYFSSLPILIWGLARIGIGRRRSVPAADARPRLGIYLFVLSVLLTLVVSWIERITPVPAWFIVPSIFLGWALVDLTPTHINWHGLTTRTAAAFWGYLLLIGLGALLFEHRYLSYPAPPPYALQQRLAQDVTRLYHQTYHQRLRFAAGTFPFPYSLAFYSPDHPEGTYGLSLAQSPWINQNAWMDHARVVVCGSQKMAMPRNTACTAKALRRFGRPNRHVVLRYRVYDPKHHQHGVQSYDVLMYKPNQAVVTGKSPLKVASSGRSSPELR